MLEYIDKTLNCFKSCFSRNSAFEWFVVIIIGLMIRSDKLGTTSIIRDLALNTNLYETMNHFFRASSWVLDAVKLKWFETVKTSAPLYKEDGYTILIGDGVKQAKESRYMPGVKKLFQESENSSKPEYIFGHMFGGLVSWREMYPNGFVSLFPSTCKTAYRPSFPGETEMKSPKVMSFR